MNGKTGKAKVKVKKRINRLISFVLTLALVLVGTGTFAGLSGILAPAIKAKAEGTELNHAVTAGTVYRIGSNDYVATATADSGDVMFIAINPTSQTYSFNELSEVFESGTDGSLDVDDASTVVSDLDKAGLIFALSMSTWQYDTTSGTVGKQGFFGVPSKADVEAVEEAVSPDYYAYSAAWTSTKADSNKAYYYTDYGLLSTDNTDSNKKVLVAFKLNLSAEGLHVYTRYSHNYITRAVPIDEEHFPDANFRNWVLSQTYGSDGVLTEKEIAETTSISTGQNRNITNLAGVEYFTALTTLNCVNNQITSLDVSNNTALTELSCFRNSLTSLDLSHNTALTTLDCSQNSLTSLDVSNNAALTSLNCITNQLTSLDVSNNTALTTLKCGYNSLTSLNVSGCTALTTLDCGVNNLTSLDLSNNTALTSFWCNNSQLTSLDLSNNTALEKLSCSRNPLTDLKYSLAASNGGTVEITNGGYGTFTPTWESYNRISGELTLVPDSYGVTDTHVFTNWAAEGTGVDLSMSSDGQTATVTFNNSESWTDKTVKISGTWGERVYVLTVKEVYQNENGEAERTETATENHSYNDSVTKTATVPEGYSIVGESSATVTMDDNKTITFTYRKNAPEGITINETTFPDANFRNWVLSQTYGSDGILTAEEIAGVTTIDVSYKEIADLTGIEYFTALAYLYCDNNQLTELDVSKNTALETLSCPKNNLTSLDLSHNTELTRIYCYGNQLTSLNVSNNSALTFLECSSNSLTSLDVSHNTALTTLGCSSNSLTILDLSHNTALDILTCSKNQFTSLDVSHNTALRSLTCDSNQLTSLNVSNNSALTFLSCSSNQLTSLDVSGCTALAELWCDNNQLTSLKLNFAYANYSGTAGGKVTISNGGHGVINILKKLREDPYMPPDMEPQYETTLKFSTNTMTLTDPTADGYVFVGWEIMGDATQTEGDGVTTFTIGSGDATITATWKQNFTVTYADGQGNTLQSTTVTEGSTTPTYSGTPERSGYTFAGWSPEIAPTVTADATYTATWKQNFTVTYADGQGNTLQSTTVTEGSATPTYSGTPTREGYTFAGWSPTVAPTVTADATYTATWTQNAPTTHTITIESRFLDKDSQLLNTTTRTATYEEGETVTIEAPAVDGYFIVGQTSVTLTIDNDGTVVFVYQQNPTTDPTDPTDPEEKPYSITTALPFKMRWQGISGEKITKTLGNVKIEYSSKQYGRFAGVALLVVDTSRLPDGKQIKVSIPNRNVTINIGGVDLAASVVAFEDTVLDNSGSQQLRIDLVTDRSDLDYDTFFGKPITGSLAISVEELT